MATARTALSADAPLGAAQLQRAPRRRAQRFAAGNGGDFDFAGADAIGGLIQQAGSDCRRWHILICSKYAEPHPRACANGAGDIAEFWVGYLVDDAEGIEPALTSLRRRPRPPRAAPPPSSPTSPDLALALFGSSRSLIWPTPMITGMGLYLSLDICRFRT